ncbi:MAG: hypothetical protein ACLSUW_01480 [Akkermansia sp.]
MQLLAEGRNLYREGKYKEALDKYNAAYNMLPAAPINDQRRQAIANNIGDASIAVAQEYIKVGRYDEADKLLQDAIRLNPKKAALAKQTLEYMKDPIRTNPALTPEHVKNVEKVNTLLHMAYGYYDLGDYDKAIADSTRFSPSTRTTWRPAADRKRSTAAEWLTMQPLTTKPAAPCWRKWTRCGNAPSRWKSRPEPTALTTHRSRTSTRHGQSDEAQEHHHPLRLF